MSPERPSSPRSGSAERRCQTTGRPSRRASHAAGMSGESLKCTSSKRWLRSVLAELMDVARKPDELAAEEEPAAPAVGRGPDVRESGDGAGVDDRARLPEELGGRAWAGSRRAARTAPGRARGSGTRATPARRRARSGGGRTGSGSDGPGARNDASRGSHPAYDAADGSDRIRRPHDLSRWEGPRADASGMRSRRLRRAASTSSSSSSARPAEIEGAEVVVVEPRLTIDWELRGTSARRHGAIGSTRS